MRASSASITGQIALALALVAIIGLVFITLFYTRIEGGGNPFATLNDVCVALGGILSAGLIWKLYPTHRSHAPRESRFTLGIGLVGACLVPIGSGLVIFNVTGWFLAGLVTTFGYATVHHLVYRVGSSVINKWVQVNCPRSPIIFGRNT